MTFRMIIVLLVVAFVMTGCTDESKEASTLTLDNVIKAIRAEGPELVPMKHTGDSAALNNVNPSAFSIANATEDVAHPEAIYVYIFDSEQEVREARSEVNGKYTIPALTAIEYYEQKNALVVYFANGGKIEKFGNEIHSALEKL